MTHIAPLIVFFGILAIVFGIGRGLLAGLYPAPDEAKGKSGCLIAVVGLVAIVVGAAILIWRP